MIGTKLAHFQITAHLGSGGMGDVYEATDSKLGRNVAVKFLPEEFSDDDERVARFEREARVLRGAGGCARIRHHSSGPETREREIASGRSSQGTGLRIGKRKWKVGPPTARYRCHRRCQVRDTGGHHSWNRCVHEPRAGAGKATDRRSDVWSFGCVLYEMLTGSRTFEVDDVTDVIAALIRAEPDWKKLPPQTSVAIQKLLQRCQEKDRKERLPDIGTARLLLH